MKVVNPGKGQVQGYPSLSPDANLLHVTVLNVTDFILNPKTQVVCVKTSLSH